MKQLNIKRYGDQRASQANTISVRNLMNNMKLTLEQALDALGIQGEDRVFITEQLQKQA